MTQISTNNKRKSHKVFFRKWHRRIGFSASIFLFILAITGIILNHYQAFSLHKSYLQNLTLLNWYGVKKPENIDCIKQDDSIVCQVDSFIFLSTSEKELQLLSENTGNLLSIINIDSEVILITDQQIQLYTASYQLIDSLNVKEQLSTLISAASYLDNELLIIAEEQLYRVDQQSFEIQIIKDSEQRILFAKAEQIYQLKDTSLFEELAVAYQQRQITYLKFVQDLHSGQLFALPGKLITDLAGFCILLLAISGFITWKRRKSASSDG